MSDVRDKIPRLAYIEAQVIHRAAGSAVLVPVVRDVERSYALKSGSLGSGVFLESRVVSLLYCLIVVPREFRASDKNHPIYGTIAEGWSLENVRIGAGSLDKDDPKRGMYEFVRHLRNAVSHARFSFEGEHFSFWDGKKPKGAMPFKEEFKASLSLQALPRPTIFLDTDL